MTGRYPASTSEHVLRLGDETGPLEPVPAYANARVPHAMIAAGRHLERPSVLSEGVRLLPREGPHDR